MFDFVTKNDTITKFGQNVKRRVVLGNYLMQSGTGITEQASNLIEA